MEENGGSWDGGGRRLGENKERGWTNYQEVRPEEDEGRNRTRVGEGKKEEGKERRNEGEKRRREDGGKKGSGR